MHFNRIDSFFINHTALKDMYEKPAPEKYNFNSKLFQWEECKKTSELAIFMEAAEERGVDYNDLIRINAVLSWQVCSLFRRPAQATQGSSNSLIWGRGRGRH